MKKVISILLSCIIVFSLCACGKDSNVGKDEIVQNWKLSYFMVGDEKEDARGLDDEPRISFSDDSITFTNKNKSHNGTWTKLDDGTYKIEFDDSKQPTEASINGDVLTVTMHGTSKELVFVFLSVD